MDGLGNRRAVLFKGKARRMKYGGRDRRRGKPVVSRSEGKSWDYPKQKVELRRCKNEWLVIKESDSFDNGIMQY